MDIIRSKVKSTFDKYEVSAAIKEVSRYFYLLRK